jgi:hypothetical protein
MKQLIIYKGVDRDDSTQQPTYFKGIESLRDFAVDRLYSGWETDVTEEDLDDDGKLMDFIRNDYGMDITIVVTVGDDDLK